MPENTQNSSEMTRPDDQSREQWLLQQQMAAEIARKKKEHPDYFEETTVPRLGPEDIIEPTTIVRAVNPDLSEPSTRITPTVRDDEQATVVGGSPTEESVDSQEDITFLHPRDVHTLVEDNMTLRSAGIEEEVDTLGATELSPSDVISEIEDRAQAASSENPTIEYRYSSPPADIAGLSEPFAEDSVPEIDVSFDDTPTSAAPATLTPEELNELWSLPLEAFLQKDTLGNADAYRLVDLIRREPGNEDIRAFTLKIAPSELDYEIFWNNLDRLSAQFIQSVLSVGAYKEVNLDVETGRQKTVLIYSGSTLQKSGMGHVFYGLMADSEDRKLQEVLIKVPLEKELELDTNVNRAAFEDEINVTRLFRRIARENSADSRLKHLLQPIHQGRGFLVMPIITSKDGSPQDLLDLAKNPASSTQNWARCLLGGVRGASLAAESGLIDVDIKPSNIMDSQNGGVLIDWGGFMERQSFERGEIDIRTNSVSGNLFPLVKNGLSQMRTDKYWNRNNGNVQRTPAYISLHLLAQELAGQMPVNTVHKFGFYRILEKYFLVRGKAERDTRDFMMLTELEKLNYPALNLQIAVLNPAEQLLYDLYLRLHQAHRHPYRFKDNNPNHGIDYDYISMEEIMAKLEEISNLSI